MDNNKLQLIEHQLSTYNASSKQEEVNARLWSADFFSDFARRIQISSLDT